MDDALRLLTQSQKIKVLRSTGFEERNETKKLKIIYNLII
jgi:hypothetical protein